MVSRLETYEKGPPGNEGWRGRRIQADVPFSLYGLCSDPSKVMDVVSVHPAVVKRLKVLAFGTSGTI